MRKTLFIFDFDDTLVFSGARVKVIHSDNSVDSLESYDYAVYEKAPDDKFDYSEFEIYPPAGELIERTFSRLLSIIAKYGKDNVIILSARGEKEPIRQFLLNAGLATDVEIVAVGSSNPQAKVSVVDSKLATSLWNRVEIFEDSILNVTAVGDMIHSKYPHVKYCKHIIKEHRKSSAVVQRLINYLCDIFNTRRK